MRRAVAALVSLALTATLVVAVREPARPASGTRRSRLHDAVGYAPPR